MAAVASDIVTSCRVKNGRLFLDDRREFNRKVALLPEDWELELSLSRLRATRSLRLNKYYWKVVVGLIAEHTGYTIDETHDALKMLHLSRSLALANGNGEVVEELVIGGSTRGLTNVDFMAYCSRIRQWASEQLDVFIPEPNEVEMF
jgi:hypothetical protein